MRGVKWRRSISLLLSLMLVLSFFSSASASSVSDLDGHWAEAEIKEWVQKGLVKGFPDGSFRPNAKITRAEFATLVNRLFGFVDGSTSEIKDISSKDWYYGEILKAKAAGYLTGYPDGTIQPNAPITRQEGAAILARLLQLDSSSHDEVAFKDESEMPSWSKGAISSVSENGFMVGFADGTFKPNKNLTRAEAIVSLNRAFKSEGTNIVYDQAGTYGPASGSETIKGNVSISAADVTLRNIVVEGNLTIEKTVGNGEVHLKGVTVKGSTFVKGGGENSIHFEDSVLLTVVVNKLNGTVRIVAAGSTSIQYVELQSSAKLEESKITGAAFQSVLLASSLPANSQITLLGDFESVEVKAATINVLIPKGAIKDLKVDANAKGANIDLAKDAKIVNLIVNAVINMLGTGRIENAAINVNGVFFQQQPDKLNLADGVKINVPPSTGGGSGGFAGGSTGGGGSSSGGSGSTPPNDTTAPTFNAADVVMIEGTTIIIPFNERIISNRANLKDGIRISYNGDEFEELAGEDQVSIGTGEHRNRLIIALEDSYGYFNEIKVKVVANTIKDEAGNIQKNDLVTGSLGVENIEVTSGAFEDGGIIPEKHTKNGDNISLPVSWTTVDRAESYLLIMYDEDVYIGDAFILASLGGDEPEIDLEEGFFAHWLVKDIPASVTSIGEGASRDDMVGVEFTNGFYEIGYGGPEPPSEHTYVLAIVALSVEKSGLEDSGKGRFNPATFFTTIEDKIVGIGMIAGTYAPPTVEVESAEISGIAQVGETLWANANPGANYLEYQWQVAEATDADDFENIIGETSGILYLTEDLVGKYIRVIINGGDSSTATSDPKLVVASETLYIVEASTYDNGSDGTVDKFLIRTNRAINDGSIDLNKFFVNDIGVVSFDTGNNPNDNFFWIGFDSNVIDTGILPKITVSAGAFKDLDGYENREILEADDIETDGADPVILTGPTIKIVDESSIELGFTSSETGTMYYMVLPQEEDEPSILELIDQGMESIVTNGEQTLTITGLVSSIDYKLYMVVEDNAGNQSIVENVSFTIAS